MTVIVVMRSGKKHSRCSRDNIAEFAMRWDLKAPQTYFEAQGEDELYIWSQGLSRPQTDYLRLSRELSSEAEAGKSIKRYSQSPITKIVIARFTIEKPSSRCKEEKEERRSVAQDGAPRRASEPRKYQRAMMSKPARSPEEQQEKLLKTATTIAHECSGENKGGG